MFQNKKISITYQFKQLTNKKSNVIKLLKIVNYIYIMNKYEILETIGQGEYGVVLKARNKKTQQLVAIKKFKQTDNEKQNENAILRQVKVLKMMNHENITELKEAFRKKGKIYLVCQYVQSNLLEIIQQNHTLERQRIKNLLLQLLKGIEYMHSINLIHRDLKPQNLLINSDNVLKICDFGFTRVIPHTGKMTDYVATRWYRAPQLLLSRDDYNNTIDIWAIGCIFSQMIIGQPLFPGQSEIDQLYLIQNGLGPLCTDHQEYFLKNEKFVGRKFPQSNKKQNFDRRYLNKIDKYGLQLLKKMLRMDPKQRITASQALKHPYFFKKQPMNIIYHKSNIDSTMRLLFKMQETQRITRQQKSGGLNTNKVNSFNKGKLINTEQSKLWNNDIKSKIIQNVQNKVSINSNATTNKQIKTLLNQQKLIKKQNFQAILQKKPKSPSNEFSAKQYLLQQEQRVGTPILKSRQNYRQKRKILNIEDDEDSNNLSSKTPILVKILTKKRVSRVLKNNYKTKNEQIEIQRKKGEINSKISSQQKQIIKINKISSNIDLIQDFEYLGINKNKKNDGSDWFNNMNCSNYNIVFNENTFNIN